MIDKTKHISEVIDDVLNNQERALKLINNSCLTDFNSALDWAQWCREIAKAGLENDEDLISVNEFVKV